MTTDTATLQAATFAERERLVGLLAGLTPEQWATPSLCEGWRVREVVAHITMAYRISGPAFFAGLLRSWFRFHRYADRAAKADTAKLTDAQLLEVLRENIRHPWQPPGGGQAGALSHDVIHGLDITEPLCLPPVPPERIALVLDGSGGRDFDYFGVDLRGTRLIATDAEVRVGDGPDEVTMPAKDVLLVLTGRRPMPGRKRTV
ncbi:maleylpyruvate isomerase family mycothiol-dependent enzyme [Georgenia alba]|uniref:Maleylpyruvate isomerase family mycothiol-dependent enzyme n=1 Tax=Georgenia alba TaxID=2233858 RepID=A0ABW2Q5Q8_9MICO